jgi:hypothetical protein
MSRPLSAWVRDNRWHLVAVAALLAFEFSLRSLLALHYESQVRPALLAAGYSSCAGFATAAPDWKLDDCDVIRRSTTPGGIEEHYFTRGGAAEVRLVVPAHGARSMHVDYRSNQAFLWLPMAAFVVFAFSLVHKMVRTGKVTRWALAAEPNDRLESVLRLYALPVFIGSILCGALGR